MSVRYCVILLFLVAVATKTTTCFGAVASWTIYETTVSENHFAFGVSVKNMTERQYALVKRGAQVYFTGFANWEEVKDLSREGREDLYVPVDVFITSWEDGDSPALRLEPGQEKWIRLEVILDEAKAKKFLDVNARHASFFIWRWDSNGWHASPTPPIMFNYRVGQGIESYCKYRVRNHCK